MGTKHNILVKCFLIATAVICTLVAGGCGDADRMTTGGVTGIVTLDGEPLDNAQIVFYTDQRMGLGNIVSGEIKDVTTYTQGDGVLLGTHRVAIRPKVDEALLMQEPTEAKIKLEESGIPLKYRDPGLSGLNAEITAGGNSVNFELKSND